MLAKRDDHLNISIKPELKAEWDKYAGRLGMRFSTWVAAKMREFVEEQQALEELKNSKK